MKISEKDSATKRTIIVPAEAIKELSDILQEVVAAGNAEPKATEEEQQQE